MNHMLKKEVADKLTELIGPMDGCRILEIGTGWAESANFFSQLKPDWTVYTIDSFGLYGDGRIYDQFNHDQVKIINESLGKNVIQILANSQEVHWELSIDVLFIDGDHTYKGCSTDFKRFSPFLNKGGFIIFDDYTQENNPNNGVKEVVSEVGKDFELVHKGYYSAIFKKL